MFIGGFEFHLSTEEYYQLRADFDNNFRKGIFYFESIGQKWAAESVQYLLALYEQKYILKKKMENVNVKIKKLHIDATIPSYAKEGDAGMDLVAISVEDSMKANIPYKEYNTGLAIEIPEGYVGLIFPRSSMSNYNQTLANCVGVIDSGYRGEIKIRLKRDADFYNTIGANAADTLSIYKIGDKVAQLIIMPYPKVTFVEVAELSVSNRGEAGFGSTNKK